jgi:hypothetical protein
MEDYATQHLLISPSVGSPNIVHFQSAREINSVKSQGCLLGTCQSSTYRQDSKISIDNAMKEVYIPYRAADLSKPPRVTFVSPQPENRYSPKMPTFSPAVKNVPQNQGVRPPSRLVIHVPPNPTAFNSETEAVRNNAAANHNSKTKKIAQSKIVQNSEYESSHRKITT